MTSCLPPLGRPTVPDPRHLEWPNVQEIVRTGSPAVQPILGEPWAHLFIDEGGGRLGVRIALGGSANTQPSPLAAVMARRVKWRGDEALEVSCNKPLLFQAFYDLVRQLADQVQLEGVAPEAALATAVSKWHQLLRPAELMSPEQQLGLAGELWVLARLLRTKGLVAVSAWTGPSDEPHDFRFGQMELEVKSTWRHTRLHAISSLEQLEATAGRRLYVLSLQMEAAGAEAGWTLPEQVNDIRLLLGPEGSERSAFEDALLTVWRYVDEDASQYGTRMEFRQPPMLVEIVEGSPRITRPMLAEALGTAVGRIRAARYDLDLEGAGVLDGNPAFLALIPEVL